MGLSIKNEEVEQLARELAAQRGVSITEAIRQSLQGALHGDQVENAQRLDRILAISQRAATLPRLTDLSDDELLGYDEFGVPTR